MIGIGNIRQEGMKGLFRPQGPAHANRLSYQDRTALQGQNPSVAEGAQGRWSLLYHREELHLSVLTV